MCAKKKKKKKKKKKTGKESVCTLWLGSVLLIDAMNGIQWCSQNAVILRTSRNNLKQKVCQSLLPKWDYITKTSLFKYTENFTTIKWKFSDKNSNIFHVSAQNIDCGYSLDTPLRGGSNEYPQSMLLSRNKNKIMYTPVNPNFTI